MLVKASALYIEDKRDDFKQILTFPLRAANVTQLPLPLVPRFIHFEDLEYNRRLASSAANASRQVPVFRLEAIKGMPPAPTEKFLFTVTLATDRQEYNPDSELALRYDWENIVEIASRATITLFRITPAGA